MNKDRRVCAREECDVEYTPVTANQIYHSEECQRLATNARIMKKYYERKARRQGAVRICEGEACMTVLSRYNDSHLCASCEKRTEAEANKKFLESLGI